NWLLVGVVGWDISRFLGGQTAVVARIIYVLVGIAAVLEIITHKSNCKACPAGTGSESSSAKPTV
ncbi:MAG: DUF378 domain-containing protein, partial [Candidatus Jacksonbacteria bacterium]|nr:DUF378 domain-containing protein [Candidatus Jacksonbacteria bacterium]